VFVHVVCVCEDMYAKSFFYVLSQTRAYKVCSLRTRQ